MVNLLVNPKTMVQCDYTPPPLGLLYTAATDSDTGIYDSALRRDDPVSYIQATKPAVVGVPMYTPGRIESLRILKAAKEQGARTVAGGPHVATMIKQLVENYDFVDHFVIGDGELAWKSICAGENLPRVIKMPVANLDDLPLPAWHTIDLSAYPARGSGIYRGIDLGRVPRISIVLGRGCAGRCTFCSSWWVNGAYRCHGKEYMKENLKILWDRGVRHLVFQDDCLTNNRQAAYDLCDILDQYQFAWFGTTRADMMELQLAKRMKACGCYELTFGIESGSLEILQRMNKAMDLEAAVRARQICRAAGIKFTALMMSGFPFETEKTKRETQIFLTNLQPDALGAFGFTMVLPGTALYKACKAKGLIDDDFWLGEEPYYAYQGGLES